MKKHLLRTIALLMAVSMMLLTVACGGSGDSQSQGGAEGEGAVARDNVVVAINASPATLDPYGTTDMPAARVTTNVFDTLVCIDENNEVAPCLAESWEIVDDLTYRFKIRQGVKFHDGTELTVNDVAFSFQKNSESPHAVTVNTNIDFPNCKIIDENTFEMKLKQPFGPILRYLAAAVMAIVPEKAYTEMGEEFGIHPVGTGPYKVVDWVTDDRIELTRFDDYWGEPAKIKDVTVRLITESTTRSIEVETGGIDIGCRILASDVARLEENPNVIVDQQETYSTNFIGLTTTQPPLDNVLVRKAINYAVDKEAILKVVYQNIGTIGSAPMSPTLFGYNDSLPQYNRDLDKARELLAEAGYPDGFDITISHNEDQTRADICEMVQAQLGEVGINVTIESLEWGAFIERIYEGSLQMFVLGWSASSGDPDVALYSSFHTDNFGAGGNMTFYSNPEVDALLEEGRVSSDEEVRKEAYMKAQEIIWDECPCVFLQHDVEITAYNKNLKGFDCTPDCMIDFAKLSW
jgi:peptide/nickel transport system substrate-binding protein